MLNNKTKELLNIIERLYKQEIEENGLEEEIGHGIEHIKGVVKRSAKVSQQIPENDRPENFDDLVATVAALHDIGNLIDRDFHNIYSGALIRNNLSLSDIPIAELSNNPIQKGTYEKAIKSIFLYYLKTNFPKELIEISIKDIYSDTSKYLQKEIAKALYEKKILENNKYDYTLKNIEDEVFLYMQELSQKDIKSLHLLSSKQLSILEEIRNNLKENFTEKEIKEIIEAVEDHNRDFEIVKSGKNTGKEDKTKPTKARNIYGQIVFDADKDDNIYTFFIRSYLFVKNGLAKKKPEIFLNRDNSLKTKRVIEDIISQCSARFSLSKQNIKNLNYFFTNFPSYAVISTADNFDDWAFASKVKTEIDGALKETDLIECVYENRECYIQKIELDKQNKINKYEIHDRNTQEYLFDLEINKNTKIPIIPTNMLIRYNDFSCGRDVRFQLPMPENEIEKSEKLEFYELMTRYSDYENFDETQDKIMTAIDIADRLEPQDAIDFFESPDSIEQVGNNYDSYKLSKEEHDKLVDNFIENKTYLPPINDLIKKVKENPEKDFNWKMINMLYNFDDNIIYFFTKEAQLITINKLHSFKSTEEMKKSFINEIKKELGEDFVRIFGYQINNIYEKEVQLGTNDMNLISDLHFILGMKKYNDFDEIREELGMW